MRMMKGKRYKKVYLKCFKKIWKIYLKKFRMIFLWFMQKQRILNFMKNKNLKLNKMPLLKLLGLRKMLECLGQGMQVKRKLKFKNLYKS